MVDNVGWELQANSETRDSTLSGGTADGRNLMVQHDARLDHIQQRNSPGAA